MKISSPAPFVFLLIISISCSTKTEESPSNPPAPIIEEEPTELFKTIALLDSLMFSTAQKDCNLEAYAAFLSDDFEYYHDKAGLTPSKEAEMSDMAIFCGEEQRTRQPLRRELVRSTLEVFPMDNYGALEHCDHLFYLQIPDGSEKLIGAGKMTALWRLEGEEWKLTRIISYDHQPKAEAELPDETLELYVGDYYLPDRVVNIVKEGKLLRVTDINDGEPGWTKELFPQSENEFYLNYENVVYEFVSEGGEITKLIIYENGEVFEEAFISE